MGQRRRHHRRGLPAIVEATLRSEELERRSHLSPSRLGGRGLIPELLGLAPQAVDLLDLTGPRGPPAAEPVHPALPRIGGFQRAGRPAPGRSQGAAPFAERVKDVQRIVDVGLARGATPGTLQLQPPAQATAVVPDHRLQGRIAGEFLSPGDAVSRLDHPPGQPTEARGLDDHQDRFRAKKISSAVACSTSGRATSSSTTSKEPARTPASRVARPKVGTLGVDVDPATTRKSRRATLRLTPSAWATVANSSCLSGVIPTACLSRSRRAWTSACCSASCRWSSSIWARAAAPSTAYATC